MPPDEQAQFGGLEKPHTVAVFGGRNYTDPLHVFQVLDDEHARKPIQRIIAGDGKTAQFAAEWAAQRGVEVQAWPARWSRNRKAAGHIRSREMIATQPDLAILFDGGKGTAFEGAEAKRRNIPIRDEQGKSARMPSAMPGGDFYNPTAFDQYPSQQDISQARGNRLRLLSGASEGMPQANPFTYRAPTLETGGFASRGQAPSATASSRLYETYQQSDERLLADALKSLDGVDVVDVDMGVFGRVNGRDQTVKITDWLFDRHNGNDTPLSNLIGSSSQSTRRAMADRSLDDFRLYLEQNGASSDEVQTWVGVLKQQLYTGGDAGKIARIRPGWSLAYIGSHLENSGLPVPEDLARFMAVDDWFAAASFDEDSAADIASTSDAKMPDTVLYRGAAGPDESLDVNPSRPLATSTSFDVAKGFAHQKDSPPYNLAEIHDSGLPSNRMNPFEEEVLFENSKRVEELDRPAVQGFDNYRVMQTIPPDVEMARRRAATLGADPFVPETPQLPQQIGIRPSADTPPVWQQGLASDPDMQPLSTFDDGSDFWKRISQAAKNPNLPRTGGKYAALLALLGGMAFGATSLFSDREGSA